MLVESQQAVFKCENYYYPREVWSVQTQTWKPYKGSVPKPEGWGDVIGDAQAREFMAPFDD